jgi:hypothetical protein
MSVIPFRSGREPVYSVDDLPVPDLEPDLKPAQTWRDNVAGPGGNLTCRPVRKMPKGIDPLSGPMLHGTIEQLFPALTKWNQEGYEIYALMNEGNGKGTGNDDIIRVRCLGLDLEPPHCPDVEAAKAAILSGPDDARPDVAVRTSIYPSPRYQMLWRADLPLERFSLWQAHLAAKFGGDPTIKNLGRLMRVPGFFHMKPNDKDGLIRPYLSKIVCAAEAPYPPPLSEEELIAIFGEPGTSKKVIALKTAPKAQIKPADGKGETADLFTETWPIASVIVTLARIDPDSEGYVWRAVVWGMYIASNGADWAYQLTLAWSDQALKAWAPHFDRIWRSANAQREAKPHWGSICHLADQSSQSGERIAEIKAVLEKIDTPDKIELRFKPFQPVQAGEWPDPKPLGDDLLPVEPFKLDLLPEAFQAYASDVAELMQCPVDFIAISLMAAAGSLIGNQCAIRPKLLDSYWEEFPNLWALIVGNPGVMKTPATKMALKPLRQLDYQARQAFERELAAYTKKKAAEEIKAKAAERRAKKALEKDQNADIEEILEAEASEKPVLRRYTTVNNTLEALGETMIENPNGILALHDEAMGLLVKLDREEKAEDREFYLAGWSGNQSYSFDRIGRGHRYIPSVTIGILGGTQPAKIIPYLRDALKTDGSDGLIARFGLLVWPDIKREWANVDRKPSMSARDHVDAVFKALNSIDPHDIGATAVPDQVPFLHFDEEALELFQEWRTKREGEWRGGELHPALVSHFTKYRKLVPALALICELVDGAPNMFGLRPTEPRKAVGADALRRALAWEEYLISHAKRAYGAVTATKVRVAKAILKKIQSGDLPDGFRARDITQSGWANLGDKDEVAEALTLLEDRDYVVSVRIEPGKKGGRPTDGYRINPKVMVRA